MSDLDRLMEAVSAYLLHLRTLNPGSVEDMRREDDKFVAIPRCRNEWLNNLEKEKAA
jgi:hypothetical protein